MDTHTLELTSQQRYARTEKGREARQRAVQKYRESEKGKAALKRASQSQAKRIREGRTSERFELEVKANKNRVEAVIAPMLKGMDETDRRAWLDKCLRDNPPLFEALKRGGVA